jgi:hypothetical protein
MTASNWCHVALAAGCLAVGCGIALPFLTLFSLLVFVVGTGIIGLYVLVRLAWPGEAVEEPGSEDDG